MTHRRISESGNHINNNNNHHNHNGEHPHDDDIQLDLDSIDINDDTDDAKQLHHRDHKQSGGRINGKADAAAHVVPDSEDDIELLGS